MTLYGDTTSDEKLVNKIEVEVKDAETRFIEVIAELDAMIDMFFVQIVPENSKVAYDKLKHTSMFSTTVTRRG